jgi:hypothetical protein
MDPNYWGLFCVPLGIFVCFGPVLLVWAFGKPKSGDKPDEKH